MIEKVRVVEWALCEAAWLERDRRLVQEMGGCRQARRGGVGKRGGDVRRTGWRRRLQNPISLS